MAKANFRIRTHGDDEHGPGVWSPVNSRAWREERETVIDGYGFRDLPHIDDEPMDREDRPVEIEDPRTLAHEMAIETAEWITGGTFEQGKARLAHFKVNLWHSGVPHLRLISEQWSDSQILSALVDLATELQAADNERVYKASGYDEGQAMYGAEPLEPESFKYDEPNTADDGVDGGDESGPGRSDSGETGSGPEESAA